MPGSANSLSALYEELKKRYRLMQARLQKALLAYRKNRGALKRSRGATPSSSGTTSS
jgi:hypothetical protein